jgi:hypothetical protein
MNIGDICNRNEWEGRIRTKEGGVKGLHAQVLKQLPCDRPGRVHEVLERTHLILGRSRQTMTQMPLWSGLVTYYRLCFVSLVHFLKTCCARALAGSATLQRGFWSRAPARRSQENAQALLWRCTRKPKGPRGWRDIVSRCTVDETGHAQRDKECL